jgi:hypothetical protein
MTWYVDRNVSVARRGSVKSWYVNRNVCVARRGG